MVKKDDEEIKHYNFQESERRLLDEVENRSEDENDKSGEALEKSKLQVNHEYQRRKL